LLHLLRSFDADLDWVRILKPSKTIKSPNHIIGHNHQFVSHKSQERSIHYPFTQQQLKHTINLLIMIAQRSTILAMAVLAAGSSGVDAFFLGPSLSTTRNVAVSTRPAFIVPATRSAPSTQQFLFGGLFEAKAETPDEGDLAKYSGLPADKYEALSEYIRLWADLFEDESKQRMGLTTPVKIFPSTSDAEGVTDSSGVRIVFQKTKTGDKYKSSKDDKAGESESEDAPKKKKKDARLEGGVQVLVETLADGDMVVRARRSDFDEDTMIKEMSEETILSELKRAMDVWRRDNNK
jgi:hypothetical protein